MALQLNYTVPRLELLVNSAYIKVNAVTVTKQGVHVDAEVWSNPDASSNNLLRPIAHFPVLYPYPEDGLMPGDNAIAWAYTELKKESEFASALDV